MKPITTEIIKAADWDVSSIVVHWKSKEHDQRDFLQVAPNEQVQRLANHLNAFDPDESVGEWDYKPHGTNFMITENGVNVVVIDREVLVKIIVRDHNRDDAGVAELIAAGFQLIQYIKDGSNLEEMNRALLIFKGAEPQLADAKPFPKEDVEALIEWAYTDCMWGNISEVDRDRGKAIIAKLRASQEGADHE